jgi:dipeptidyl aminopeptidase/acylaminoacyl peptidase
MLKSIKIFFIVFFAATAYSQDTVLDSYNLFNLKSVADAEVSPDGKYISYTVNIPRPFTDTPGTDYKHNGGSPKKITSAESTIKEFEFHPDGSKLAYVSSEPEFDRKKELKEKGFDAEIYEEEIRDLNLYMHDFKKNESKKLTSNFSVYDFEWSPDGSKIMAVCAEKIWLTIPICLKEYFS